MTTYRPPGPPAWAVLAVTCFLIALAVAWAFIMYDDWRCAFGDCRIVKP